MGHPLRRLPHAVSVTLCDLQSDGRAYHLEDHTLSPRLSVSPRSVFFGAVCHCHKSVLTEACLAIQESAQMTPPGSLHERPSDSPPHSKERRTPFPLATALTLLAFVFN
jgi:hypothetical protein